MARQGVHGRDKPGHDEKKGALRLARRLAGHGPRPVQPTMALLWAARNSATERALRPVSASKAPETMAK